MDFYKTTAAFGATACLLMASTAFGTAIRSETFEGSNDVGAWTGGVAQEAGSPAGVAPAGLPISSTAGAKVLSVTGSATNTVGTTSGDTLVDMMVKVSIPDSALTELATGEGGEAVGAKFAVAVDTDGTFKYWNGAAWTTLSSTQYTEGAWVRLTMKFYYTKQTPTCVVALNGNTCSECPLIATATTLASIEVKGSTALDEVLVTQDNMDARFADSTATYGDTGIKNSWLSKYNVPWSNATGNAPDYTTSGLTVAQKYAFGLNPTDGSKCTLEFVQDDRQNKALLKFPGYGAYDGDGYYVLQTKTGEGSWGLASPQPGYTRENGVNEFLVSLPNSAGTAVYYRITPALGPQSYMSPVAQLDN